jgi:Bacterial Ig-like domain (group 3)
MGGDASVARDMPWLCGTWKLEDGLVKINKRAVLAAGVAVFAAAMPLLAAPASASAGPPWEPDTHALGTLTFYNSSGTAITGGSDLSHIADYAEASTADAGAGFKATLFFAQPTYGQDPGNWPAAQASLSSVTPPSGAPAPLNTATNPVSSISASYGNLTSFINGQTAQTQPGYVNVYEVRLVTTGGSGGSNGTGQYWDADIMVNGSAWVEVYPTAGSSAVGTTTTLAAAPATSASEGASVTLTATVTADDTTHPAGSVEFFDGPTDLGAGDVNTSTGVATFVTTGLLASSPGGTSLTATFNPSDTSSYSPSTSAAVSYTINPIATKPTISGPHQVGGAEKCTESNLDYGVTATYSWLVSGKAAGSGKSFTVPASAYKKSLACQVAVKDGAGPSSTATSSAVTVSLGKALKATKKPALSGPHKVGKKETVSSGKWSPSASKYGYQWFDGKKKIKGATKSSLKLTKAQKGGSITCVVTASKTGYAKGTATTKAVKVS